MRTAAITAEALGKRYRIGLREQRPETLVATLASLGRSPLTNLGRLRSLTRTGGEEERPDLIWALREVSFEVGEGEVLGIVGRNGAGKSTLLKILSRITEPTHGRAAIRGRVASLLEVGTGFHPELTGRENVYLNGTILGMSKREIDGAFEEIVEFAGVDRFLDTPIKRYSSGMKVRLAFAVAAHLRAEVLLIDEVLAVGDASFQRKCLGKMDQVARSGRTILFVSHNMAAITNLCHRCLFLDGGSLVSAGAAGLVVRRYLDAADHHSRGADLAVRTDREGSGRARLTSFEVVSPDAERPQAAAFTGSTVVFRLGYRVEPDEPPISPVQASLQIYTADGTFLTALTNAVTGEKLPALEREGYLYCRVPRFPLMAGRYRVTLILISGEGVVDLLRDAATFDVEVGDYYGTGRDNSHSRQGVFMEHGWSARWERRS